MWDKTVASAPDFTNDWYAGLGNGTYATWLTRAWGPVFLSGVAAKSSGKLNSTLNDPLLIRLVGSQQLQRVLLLC